MKFIGKGAEPHPKPLRRNPFLTRKRGSEAPIKASQKVWNHALPPAFPHGHRYDPADQSDKEEVYGMFRKLVLTAGLLGLVGGALLLAPPAHAQGVKVGALTCNVSGSFGFIFGSTRSLNCTFSTGQRRYEHYVGTINKFGVDIGYIKGGVLVWSVVAPTAVPSPCALAGNYGGASANATVGVGLGANVLVGGSRNSIALQPVSIEGTSGLNVAAGVASMNLRCAPA